MPNENKKKIKFVFTSQTYEFYSQMDWNNHIPLSSKDPLTPDLKPAKIVQH